MKLEIDKILSQCISPEVPIKCIEYKGIYVPDSYLSIAESIENFEVREDDVWICGFSKTGSTWTSEMVWCIDNDLNFEGSKIPLSIRCPLIEFSGATTRGWVSMNAPSIPIEDHMGKSVEFTANLQGRRLIKTHLPFHLLPKQIRNGEKKCKIIFLSRDPKDVCISYYHHYKLLEAYCGTFDEFCKLFLADKVYYAPFWENMIGFWENKDKLDIMFIRYEDMKKNLASIVKKTASFIGKSLTDDQVEQLKNHLSFSNMKKNSVINCNSEAINRSKIFGENYKAEGEFVRKGESGQWKTVMSEELIRQFDEWTAKKLQCNQDLHKQFL